MARFPKAIRDLVIRRARSRCEYCRSSDAFSHQSFSIEHIRPRSRGGSDLINNLALSCQGCNAHKHNRTAGRDVVSRRQVRLFLPRRDRWADHFAWTDDGTRIVGITAIGRATVELLRLNRDAIVNLRRVLVRVGEHPPSD